MPQKAEARAPRSLQVRLEGAFAEAESTRTVIGEWANGRRTYAAVGSVSGRGDAEPFRTGCIAKLLVAALLERKLSALGIEYDVPVRRLPWIGADAEPLGATTLRQLLEHTHGLDDSDLPGAPRRTDGRIDLERLLVRLRGRRFASPGALYSYSNAGAWIIAALLESFDGRPFAEQLHYDLLEPLGISVSGGGRAPGRSPSASAVCPATGCGLALTVADLLTFLAASTAMSWSASAASASGDWPRISPLPGWHPNERGICLGWKHYGDGWFGHQSSWPGASLLLRVRAQDRRAIVVASELRHAAVVAARVWGRELPELHALSLPRPLSAEAAARLEPSLYCGRYVSASASLVVEADAAGLVLRVHRFRTRLIPASDEIFFLEAGMPDRSFVQFIGRAGGAFRALWDGRRVFPLAGC